MKNQVTSIEQSRLLIELGVPAKKASMVWAQCSGEYYLSVLPHYMASKEYIECGESIPAFTVADLLEKVLPNVIQTKHNTYELTLSSMAGGGWRFYYQPALAEFETDNIGDEMSDDLITLLCDRVEWLLSNGYKLEV